MLKENLEPVTGKKKVRMRGTVQKTSISDEAL